MADACKILKFILGKCGYCDVCTKYYGDGAFGICAVRRGYFMNYNIVSLEEYKTPDEKIFYSDKICIMTKKISYDSILKALLDACASKVVCIDDGRLIKLLKKGTTLEQILVEMDLNEQNL